MDGHYDVVLDNGPTWTHELPQNIRPVVEAEAGRGAGAGGGGIALFKRVTGMSDDDIATLMNRETRH